MSLYKVIQLVGTSEVSSDGSSGGGLLAHLFALLHQ